MRNLLVFRFIYLFIFFFRFRLFLRSSMGDLATPPSIYYPDSFSSSFQNVVRCIYIYTIPIYWRNATEKHTFQRTTADLTKISFSNKIEASKQKLAEATRQMNSIIDWLNGSFDGWPEKKKLHRKNTARKKKLLV